MAPLRKASKVWSRSKRRKDMHSFMPPHQNAGQNYNFRPHN